jgi:endonuclease YncB( thermonuclease family)
MALEDPMPRFRPMSAKAAGCWRDSLSVLAIGAGLWLALAPPAAPPASAQAATPPASERRAAPPSAPRERKPQPRPSGQRVIVDPASVTVDDGDTAIIRWTSSDAETVRFLGIDTPETRHVAHELPYAQSFGPEARAFGQGAFAAAGSVELVRSPTLDPYGRSLGYFFLNGKSYSVLVVKARLAEESVSRYGDNGLPKEAAEVLAAAKAAGPLPFESPGDFRRRMRDVSRWMKERGVSPEQ